MKQLFLVVVGVAVLGVIAYGGVYYMQHRQSSKSVMHSKSASQLTPKLRVVNVLSEDLFADAHIKGSINIPFEHFEEVIKNWDKDTTVVVYCANYACSASGAAAQMLRKAGFAKAFAYEGGTAEWYQLHQSDPSYELEGPAKQDYLTVAVKRPQQHGDFEIITAEKLKGLLQNQ